MNRIPKYFVAFLAACVVPALFIIVPYAFGSLSMGDSYGWVRIKNFSVMTLLISGAHVVLLGVPLFLVLAVKNMVRGWSAIISGFVLGSIPVAVWAWPLRYAAGSSSSHWDGEKMVNTMVNGVVTIAGWLSYVKGVLFMGAFGAIGGLSFWLVWRLMSPNKSLNQDAQKARAC
jgi:hypothetical protein